jgi:hypothetical protein
MVKGLTIRGIACKLPPVIDRVENITRQRASASTAKSTPYLGAGLVCKTSPLPYPSQFEPLVLASIIKRSDMYNLGIPNHQLLLQLELCSPCYVWWVGARKSGHDVGADIT